MTDIRNSNELREEAIAAVMHLTSLEASHPRADALNVLLADKTPDDANQFLSWLSWELMSCLDQVFAFTGAQVATAISRNVSEQFHG